MRQPDGTVHTQIEPGNYCKGLGEDSGWWHFKTPNGLFFTIPEESDPKYHRLVEHEDGTVTLSPSVLAGDGNHSYHGFIDRGVWRSC